MKKVFKSFSEFGERSIELFESSDPHMTAIYFTNHGDKHLKNSDARFQALHFGYKDTNGKWYDQSWYFRKPGDDHFIELTGSSKYSRGNMEKGSCTNPWEELSFQRKYEYYKHDQDLLITFYSEFNFMKLIARSSKDEFDFRESVISCDFGKDKINIALSLPYLKLPLDLKKIEYAYKLKDTEEVYILTHYPHYEFSYENQACFYIQGDEFEQLTISAYQRYRDGGTTYFDATDKIGTVHKFYSPTFFEPEKVATWDGIEMEPVENETETMTKLIKLLNIELVEKSPREIEAGI